MGRIIPFRKPRKARQVSRKSRLGLDGRQLVKGLVVGAAIAGLVLSGAAARIGKALTFIDLDCADLRTQAEAQAYFVAHGPGDPSGLDADHDGRACEWNR